MIEEPQFDGMTVREFVDIMFDHLCCAAEDVSAHLLRRQFPNGIGVHEIPLAERTPEAPERFKVTTAVGGEALWSIAYPNSRFEQH